MIRLRDVMKERVESVSPGDSAQTAWERMRASRIRHLVVLDGKEVVGVLSDRDLIGRGPLRREEKVGDVMTSPGIAGHPEMTLRQVANQMRGRSVGCLPVIEEGKLVGILTTTDVLELVGRGVQRPVAKAARRILNGRGPRRRPRSEPKRILV
ncbi:MAG: CBS domain-containing protein [Thermoanaerobaculia bacterium]